ncbi:MAG: hypothetical protein PHR36_01655 [Patescibacteria group bacterium]|nr:hypothetical protein [Patescibacteria group bacterium]
MAGKTVFLIIGVILLAVAAWLYWGTSMTWTAAVALILAVIAFIWAFVGGKKGQTPPTSTGGEPKVE